MIEHLNSAMMPESPAITAPSANAAKLRESAEAFEALLIGQMLKSAREAGGGWFGGGEDQAASTATGMAEEHLAQTLASQGGLGLASMVMKGVASDQVHRDAEAAARAK